MIGKQRVQLLFTLIAFLFNSACAQNPPGLAFVNEEKQVEQATVLLNNDKYLIPLQNLADAKIASVHFSSNYHTAFDSLLSKYTKVQPFNGNTYMGVKSLNDLTQDLKFYNTLIVQVNDADLNNPQIINFITTNQTLKKLVVAFNGLGVGLNKLNNVTAPIIWSDRVSNMSAWYSAQAIFGGVPITHKLDASYSAKYMANMGYITQKTRLQYTVPEDAGINSNNLLIIDEIAREAINARATPGMVILVAKDGKVIFNKAYGSHTYSGEIPDKITDIFDLASMTKTSATTVQAMQLYDQGKLKLDSTLGSYIAPAKNTNKNTLTVRELLTHQAGLIADIPTFERVRATDHSVDSSAAFPIKVNERYYLRKNYFNDVMWPAMLSSPVRTRGQYVYSDVGMCFMQQIAETLTSMPLDKYVQQQFYNPLGMQTSGFLPLQRFNPDQIVPTENDRVYRKTLMHGYVNDPTAALMGGVAGHAGLFSNANDVAILYQMLLNKGTYGGEVYIKPETVDLFTAKQSAVSRRGLGFDRWDPIAERKYPSELASDQAYGHTGYTGTCVWVDPKYNLVYVFLSNRVHPSASEKLSSLRIRPRIQDAVYKAIEKGFTKY
jgi:CubicO group peptidase (beta-lactamase class C family)